MRRYFYPLFLVLLALLIAIPFAAAQQLPPNGDYDKDGVINSQDACPAKGDQGYGLKPNGCPKDAPPPPPPDSDGDGVADSNDACPNEGDLGNGLLPNGCPIRDDDGDGIANANDACPNVGNMGYGLQGNGCPIPPPDSDGDGILDPNDSCPNEGDLGNGLLPNGCPIRDDDGDGVANANDACPNEGNLGNGLLPNGCPIRDDDGDGVANANDSCPNEGDLGNGLLPNGCPIRDNDGDGIANVNDACPDDAGNRENNGCPVDEDSTSAETAVEIIGQHQVCTGEDDSENCLIDTDKDGVPDLVDTCPDETGDKYYRGCAAPPDIDGDGVPDPRDHCDNLPGPEDNAGCPLDVDRDGVPNEIDHCIAQPGPINNNGCPLDTDGDGLTGLADRCPDLFAETEDGCPTPDAIDTNMCYVTTMSQAGIPTYDGLDAEAAIVGQIHANQIYSVIGMGSNFVQLADGSFALKQNLVPSKSCLNKVQDSLAASVTPAEATPEATEEVTVEAATATEPEEVTVEATPEAEPEVTIEATPEATTEPEPEVFFIFESVSVTVYADTDTDGLRDDVDVCPYDFGETANGCPDTDGDGSTDDIDLCIEYAGPPTNNGCPDRDGDGFFDFEDGCPLTVGEINGCPDSDDDGIGDNVDFCPDLKGVKGNWGCPPDNDGDGIYNYEDDCPDEFAVNIWGPIIDGETGEEIPFDGCPIDIDFTGTIEIVDEDNDGIPDYEDDCVCSMSAGESAALLISSSSQIDGTTIVFSNSSNVEADAAAAQECSTEGSGTTMEVLYDLCGESDGDNGVWDDIVDAFDDAGASYSGGLSECDCGQTGG